MIVETSQVVSRLRLEPRRLASGRRPLLGLLLYGLLLAAGALTAYWSMFSTWQPFDDEGFFNYSLKMVLAGHPLYSTVNSAYGPFYYIFFWLFFKLTGLTVTTAAGRMITLATWLISSLGLGLTAHRATRSLWLGLAVMLSTLIVLATLITSPMHAQIVVLLLTSAAAAVALLGLDRSERAAPAALGALLAALALTKVNLGGYATIAIAVAVVFAGPARFRRRWLLALATAVFVCLPLVVMASELHIQQERMYALVVACSALSLAIAAWPRKSTDEGNQWSDTLWLWMVGGFVACAVLVLFLLAVTGGGLTAWFQQTIVAPTHQATLLQLSLNVNGIGLACGVAGVLCALAVRRGWVTSRLTADRTVLVSGAARLVTGLAILVPALHLIPALNTRVPYPYGFSWALAWVAAVPLVGEKWGSSRLARTVVVALAISQSLMAYPVAGAQVALGAVLFPLCGALCFADGARELARWARPHKYSWVAPVFTTGLIAVMTVVAGHRQYSEALPVDHRIYQSEAALTGEGTAGIRVDPSLAKSLNFMVSAVKGAHCTALMELPGQYSFNLWTGVKTPLPTTAEQSYWFTLTRSEQSDVLTAARRTPRMCLITDDAEVGFYTQQVPIPKVPLMKFLRTEFRPIAGSGDWKLEVRRQAR